MLTILEHAILANHVYHPDHSSQNGVQIISTNKTKKGSPKTGWYRLTDVEKTMSSGPHPDGMDPKLPFYAQLYLKFENGQAVWGIVAYRGTAFKGMYTLAEDAQNGIVDAVTWYKNVFEGNNAKDRLPFLHYANRAALFFYWAQEYCRAYFPELPLGKIHVTGHSLGGALAALIPAHFGMPARAAMFNAPGIGTMPNVPEKFGAWITRIDARYDFVSKIGKRISLNAHLLDVPNLEFVAKLAFETLADAKSRAEKVVTADNLIEKAFDAGLAYIDAAVATPEMGESLHAQHSMDHLIGALQKSSLCFQGVV